MITRSLLAAFFMVAVGAVFFGVPSASATDVSKLDVGGVRIYMSAEEAIEAIKARYGQAAQFEIGDKRVSRLNSSVQIVNRIRVKFEQYSLAISLVERLPAEEKRPEAVYEVTLYGATTANDRETLGKAAIAKYGLPDTSVDRHPAWCSAPHHGECVLVDAGPVIYYSVYDGSASITLRDTLYQKRVDKHYQSMPRQKPPL